MNLYHLFIKNKRKLKESHFFYVSSLTTISTGLKIGATFISAKVLAVLTGPTGIAMLGQLTNFVTILLQVCTGATGTGIVKLSGQYKDEPTTLKKVYSTSFTIISIFTIITILTLLLFQNSFTQFIFNDLKYKWLLFVVVVSLPLISVNVFIVSVLSGLYEFKKYIKIQSIASVLSVIMTVSLVCFFKIEGALLAYVLLQSLVFFVSLYYSKIINWKDNISLLIDKEILKKLSHFSLYVIISAFCFPFAQILVRNLIIDKLGIDTAGIWEGTNRISSMYLLLISSAIGVYFFPKVSGISNNKEVTKELNFALKMFVSATIFAGLLLLLLKSFIIPIALSEKFLPINDILYIQVIGDVFLIAKMLFSMVLLSRDKTKIMIFLEVISTIIYVGLNYLFINNSPVLSHIIWVYPIYTVFYFLTLFVTYKTIINDSKN